MLHRKQLQLLWEACLFSGPRKGTLVKQDMLKVPKMSIKQLGKERQERRKSSPLHLHSTSSRLSPLDRLPNARSSSRHCPRSLQSQQAAPLLPPSAGTAEDFTVADWVTKTLRWHQRVCTFFEVTKAHD